MFYDYHMHSSFSTDGKSTMEEMVKKSIELGLEEICFTDHVDYMLMILFQLSMKIILRV